MQARTRATTRVRAWARARETMTNHSNVNQ